MNDELLYIASHWAPLLSKIINEKRIMKLDSQQVYLTGEICIYLSSYLIG